MRDLSLTFLFVILLFLPVFLKRKRQIGRTWEQGRACARVAIKNIDLKCYHCSSDLFYKREALFVTTFLTLFNLNVFNQSGAAYQCLRCGFIHWFSRPQESAVNFLYDEDSHPSTVSKE